jgi:hypothetical protein
VTVRDRGCAVVVGAGLAAAATAGPAVSSSVVVTVRVVEKLRNLIQLSPNGERPEASGIFDVLPCFDNAK